MGSEICINYQEVDYFNVDWEVDLYYIEVDDRGSAVFNTDLEVDDTDFEVFVTILKINGNILEVAHTTTWFGGIEIR